jgi:YD repeat-containing protein
VVTTTNPMDWNSNVTVDPGRGSTLASTDVNGELTSYTYDGLGDATAVWSPLRSKAAGAPADDIFSYSETGGDISISSTGVITETGTASAVSTSTLRNNGSYSTSIDIYDGLLRAIQVQAPLANGQANGKLLTDTHYNSLGQTYKASSQYMATGTTDPSTTVDVPVNDTYVPAETETLYDGMGRTVKSETLAFGVNQYATTTSYPGMDQTDVTPPSGGTATSTFTDALGREISGWK